MDHARIAALSILFLSPALCFAEDPPSPSSADPPKVTPATSQEKPPADPVLSALADLKNDVAALQQRHVVRDVGPVVVGMLGLIVSIIISAISLNRNAKSLSQTLRAKAHEEERKAIREKRDRFYGPFTQLRGISQHLYGIFLKRRSPEEMAQFEGHDGKFKTLIALCRGHKFEGIDKVLLDAIVRLGVESETLITKEIGLVDNVELQEVLWRAAAHYRIIKLASEGQLANGGEEFATFTFPQQVDGLLRDRIKALDSRLAELEMADG